ncbi:MAG: hypothetical protein L3J70_06665 [Gammaproteobacteria bacterium]|nr:hypothetical protein [Gammaproteobacteria bacterium]
MKKIVKYFLYITLSLLLIITLSIFLSRDYISQIEISAVIPPKPANIPQNALWVGGPDGGMYVLVQKSNEDNSAIYNAEIYHSSGSVSYKGKLVINSPDNPQFNYNDVNSYSLWDGDTLFLLDGRQLTIVNEFNN